VTRAPEARQARSAALCGALRAGTGAARSRAPGGTGGRQRATQRRPANPEIWYNCRAAKAMPEPHRHTKRALASLT